MTNALTTLYIWSVLLNRSWSIRAWLIILHSKIHLIWALACILLVQPCLLTTMVANSPNQPRKHKQAQQKMHANLGWHYDVCLLFWIRIGVKFILILSDVYSECVIVLYYKWWLFLSASQGRVIIILLVELVNDEHHFDKKNILLIKKKVHYYLSVIFILSVETLRIKIIDY